METKKSLSSNDQEESGPPFRQQHYITYNGRQIRMTSDLIREARKQQSVLTTERTEEKPKNPRIEIPFPFMLKKYIWGCGISEHRASINSSRGNFKKKCSNETSEWGQKSQRRERQRTYRKEKPVHAQAKSKSGNRRDQLQGKTKHSLEVWDNLRESSVLQSWGNQLYTLYKYKWRKCQSKQEDEHK